MATITRDNVTEINPHLFVADASDFNETRDGWPPYLTTSLGNKLDFARSEMKRDPDEGILWVLYVQLNGNIVLKLFND